MPKENNKVGVGCGVMIIRDDKILLGLRNADPEKADSELHGESTWTMPGGKMRFGETPEECAYREILEETGIEVDKEKISVICLNNDKVSDAHFITIGLLYEESFGKPKVMEPDEITEWKWFDLQKLPDNMFFPSKRMSENYLQKKFYIPRP